MRLLLVFIVGIACALAGVVPGGVPGDNSGYKEGDRYIWFPNENGEPVLVDLEQPLDPEVAKTVNRRGANNLYVLFTRQNPTQPQFLTLGDANTLSASNYNPNRITKVLIHGWNNYYGSTFNTMLRDALLSEGDYNILVVDWEHSSMSDYITAVAAVPSIGLYSGYFIAFLVSVGTPIHNFHIIGYSLGAHISGQAGRALGGVVGRITGLDPAGPLYGSSSNTINANDGRYVEIIHTDAGLLGLRQQCGDADFYPNGGSGQPGCLLSTCSHSRAYQFFAATVENNHLLGTECDSLEQATSGTCSGTRSLNMGNAFVQKRGYGIYYLTTGSSYPY